MSIHRHNNRYVANFRNKKGMIEQVYFHKEEDAIKYHDSNKAPAPTPGSTRTKKKCTAKHKDVPIGIGISRCKKVLIGGRLVIYHVVFTHIYRRGKVVKRFTARFGKLRTREKAISIVWQKRKEWIIHNPPEEISS